AVGVNGVGFVEMPAGGGRDEYVEVGHLSVVPEEGVADVFADAGAADDVVVVVYGIGARGFVAKCAEVNHFAVEIAEGVYIGVLDFGKPDDVATVVEADGAAPGTAGKDAEVADFAVFPYDGVFVLRGVVGLTYDEIRVRDRVGGAE